MLKVITFNFFYKEFFIECRDRARQRGYFLCEKVTKSTQTTRLIREGSFDSPLTNQVEVCTDLSLQIISS